MKQESESQVEDVLPVLRTKEQARRFYDRISRIYDLFTLAFERRYAEWALERLSIRKGEVTLEIGFGTGHCLRRIARSVGPTGKTHGIDISTGMQQVAKRKLETNGLSDRVELLCGDAARLPYCDSTFDAVFMSFTLELFDTPEIPLVLEETRRVLKPGGRIGVVGMSKESGRLWILRTYEWAHKKLPRWVDCRPIYVEQSMRASGYEIRHKDKVSMAGLPGEIVVGLNRK